MKKIINRFSILAIASLLAVSCKDDGPDNASLINSWKETSTTISECTDSTENGTETCSGSSCETIVIGETTVSADGDTYTYTKSGSTLTVTDGTFTFTVTYSISGNTLTITQKDSVDDGNCKYVTKYTKV